MCIALDSLARSTPFLYRSLCLQVISCAEPWVKGVLSTNAEVWQPSLPAWNLDMAAWTVLQQCLLPCFLVSILFQGNCIIPRTEQSLLSRHQIVITNTPNAGVDDETCKPYFQTSALTEKTMMTITEDNSFCHCFSQRWSETEGRFRRPSLRFMRR